LAIFLLAGCAATSDEQVDVDDSAVTRGDARLGEAIEDGEEAGAKEIARVATESVRASLASSTESPKRAKRDAHPKAHGCVKATVTMASNAPADLAVGTFAAGKRYDAWIRFSNGSQADDRKRDARGMAIKLMNVDGVSVLGTTDKTHDLVLTNHHTFFLDNISTYVSFMNKVGSGSSNLLSVLSFGFDSLFNDASLRKLLAFTGQKISSPLTARYFSATPYQLGDRIVKYAATPCGGADTSGDHADDADYLGDAMRAGLSRSGACFDLQIQRQSETGLSPVEAVEEVTETWQESRAPFRTVGRIEIPAQTFDSAGQQRFCEDLSFTPWHAPKGHRPLGRINRTRKVVYEATSAERHRLNGAARREPTDFSVPE